MNAQPRGLSLHFLLFLIFPLFLIAPAMADYNYDYEDPEPPVIYEPCDPADPYYDVDFCEPEYEDDDSSSESEDPDEQADENDPCDPDNFNAEECLGCAPNGDGSMLCIVPCLDDSGEECPVGYGCYEETVADSGYEFYVCDVADEDGDGIPDHSGWDPDEEEALDYYDCCNEDLPEDSSWCIDTGNCSEDDDDSSEDEDIDAWIIDPGEDPFPDDPLQDFDDDTPSESEDIDPWIIDPGEDPFPEEPLHDFDDDTPSESEDIDPWIIDPGEDPFPDEPLHDFDDDTPSESEDTDPE
jgi:hypothetical protein